MNRIRNKCRVEKVLAWLLFFVAMGGVCVFAYLPVDSNIFNKLHTDPYLMVGVIGISFALSLLFAIIDASDPTRGKK